MNLRICCSFVEIEMLVGQNALELGVNWFSRGGLLRCTWRGQAGMKPSWNRVSFPFMSHFNFFSQLNNFETFLLRAQGYTRWDSISLQTWHPEHWWMMQNCKKYGKSRDSLPEALFERHIRMWILPQMQLTGLDWNVWSGRLVDEKNNFDSFGSFGWLVRFIQAQEAFRWLSDPQQREVYVWRWNHRY